MNQSYDAMMVNCEKKIVVLNDNLNDATCLLKKMKKHLEKEKADVDKMIEMAKQYDVPDGDIVKLNVGGSHFSTMKSTLTKKIKKPDDFDENKNKGNNGEYYEPHLLQLLVSGIAKITYDENKDIFIDRNPHYFGYILDFLRNVGTSRPYKMPKLSADALGEFYDEAEYYNIQGLLEVKNSQSNILTTKMFVELCRFVKTQEWKLIYRGSRDGFGSNHFHSKCDNYPNTLTVVKSTSDCVFGGYTNVAWDQSGTYKADANAFIFSLVNKSNMPARINCVNATYAIYCVSAYGPSFGASHGFYIASDANSNSNSNANLSGSYYQTPPNNISAKKFLVDSLNFQVKEVEVFEKI